MKKHLHAILWVTCVAVGFYLPTQAQSVTIDPSNATAGHIIEAKSTKKGLLMPVMNQTQRTALNTPVAGVQIYCTNCSGGAGPYTYNGSVWVPMFNTAGITYVIGQSAQGGKIFYVDDTGQHGLVVATADFNLSQLVTWLNSSNISTNAVRSGIYGGEYNTQRINEVQMSGTNLSAALAAAQFDGGNYGDWYLPSKLELLLLYQQRANVGMAAVTNVYWSSTEVPGVNDNSSNTAYYLDFSNGSQSTAPKTILYRVRPIRRF
jgi:hypothetical protein